MNTLRRTPRRTKKHQGKQKGGLPVFVRHIKVDASSKLAPQSFGVERMDSIPDRWSGFGFVVRIGIGHTTTRSGSVRTNNSAGQG